MWVHSQSEAKPGVQLTLNEPPTPLLSMLATGVAEHGQRLAHVVGVAAAARRQRHALADPLQQLEAEIAFEQAQLVADGAARQMQFVGGAPDAAMARETVERAQRLGRWDLALHPLR